MCFVREVIRDGSKFMDVVPGPPEQSKEERRHFSKKIRGHVRLLYKIFWAKSLFIYLPRVLSRTLRNILSNVFFLAFLLAKKSCNFKFDWLEMTSFKINQSETSKNLKCLFFSSDHVRSVRPVHYILFWRRAWLWCNFSDFCEMFLYFVDSTLL